jgi:DNA-binding GntR family transcriptional regulator
MGSDAQDLPGVAMEAPFLSARRATIAVQIYNHLRQQVVTGALRPMQCLSEKDLATTLGVSRTPIREALGKLEEEGLIQIRPQYGTFVAPILPESVASSQFVREALECAGVREAASRCTDADRKRLLDILAHQHACDGDTAFFEADDALHRMLMGMAGHEAVWRVVHAAKATIDRVRFLSVQRSTKRQAILAEHQRIVDCVCDGNAAGAAEAMRQHLRGVFESTEQTMQQHPEFFQSQPAATRPNRRRPRV